MPKHKKNSFLKLNTQPSLQFFKNHNFIEVVVYFTDLTHEFDCFVQAGQATTAAQPVGFTAGLKGAEDRINNLRQTGSIPDGQAIVSIEGFIVEMLPDRYLTLVFVKNFHFINLT